MVHARDFWGYDSVKNCPRNIGFMPETRTVEQKVKDLRSFVCFENCPCKIVEIVTPIDPAKRRFDRTKRQYVAIGIFTEKVFEATFSLSDTCDVPIVTLTDYELVDIYEKDSHVTLLDDKGNIRQDLKLPADLLSNVKSGLASGKDVFVSVVSAMGKEKIVASKTVKRKWQLKQV
ncbi:eukaryotic translation initiation factor 5A-1-like isoform X1 [Apium graveolens]|uniref:eukaryotic translation initiation factor 5A-1-like isoform X1 n=1 Tax=Apium graveolens TaxID=4045 RepID=UPI003D78B631